MGKHKFICVQIGQNWSKEVHLCSNGFSMKIPLSAMPEPSPSQKLKKIQAQAITRLQVLLGMARNLSINTRCKKDSKGEKSAIKGPETV